MHAIIFSIIKEFVLYYSLPQHFLYFFPLPQGHGSFLPILKAWNLGIVCNLKISLGVCPLFAHILVLLQHSIIKGTNSQKSTIEYSYYVWKEILFTQNSPRCQIFFRWVNYQTVNNRDALGIIQLNMIAKNALKAGNLRAFFLIKRTLLYSSIHRYFNKKVVKLQFLSLESFFDMGK